MTCPSFCHDEGCTLSYARHLNFSVSADALPTRKPLSAAANRQDRQRNKDLDAYKRLRDDKHQPVTTSGAHRLEAQATTPEHISTGLLNIKPESFKRYENEFGHAVTEPQAA